MKDNLLWFFAPNYWRDRQIAQLKSSLEAVLTGPRIAPADEELAGLRLENAELRLYLAALLRILIEKRLVAPDEVRAAAEALTTEGVVGLEPPREADWAAAPPPARDME
jgi:hypothetical protein